MLNFTFDIYNHQFAISAAHLFGPAQQGKGSSLTVIISKNISPCCGVFSENQIGINTLFYS